MKKFYFALISALLLAGSASAANVAHKPVKNLDESKVVMSLDKKADRHARVEPGKIVKGMKVAAKAEAAAPDVIFDAPAGEDKIYARSAYVYSVFWGMFITLDEVSYQAVTIRYCADDVVYIKNPNCSLSAGTWIKGKKDGDKLKFQLPQMVYYIEEDGESYGLDLMMLEYVLEDEDEGGWYYPAENQEASFSIAEDGSLTLDVDDEGDLIMGLCEDGEWTGYGDYAYTLVPFDMEPVAAPTGAPEPYIIKLNPNYGVPVNVVFEGSDVYFGGLSQDLPDAWMKGKLADGKVTIPSGQYMGIAETYSQFVFSGAAKVESVYDEEWEEWYDELNWEDCFVFDYDAETKVFSSAEGKALLINGNPEEVYYLSAYASPELKPFDPNAEPAVPANPTDLEVYDYFEDYGESQFIFSLPNFDVNGNYLNPENMYYNIFTDQDYIEKFSPDFYEMLEEEIVDVPYLFTDGFDIGYEDDTHYVYYYFGGVDRIGVQSCYKTADGKVLKSDIVYYDFDGVADVVVDKTVKSVEYYDMLGRRVANPANGMFITKVNYTDGTAKATKIAKH